jgi:hypothetical protein
LVQSFRDAEGASGWERRDGGSRRGWVGGGAGGSGVIVSTV